MNSVFYSLAVSLCLTLVLESLFYLLVKQKSLRDWAVVLLVNVLTNPIVVLVSVLTHLDGWKNAFLTVGLEAAAVLCEGVFYKLCAAEIKKPFVFSLCANAFSYIFGLVLLNFLN